MRPRPYITIAAALIAIAIATATIAAAQPPSATEWQQRQAHLAHQQRLQQQQQQLDDQQAQLRRLRAAQRRQATLTPYAPTSSHGTPLPNTPVAPRPAATPTLAPHAQAYIDRIMADPTLSRGAKQRLVRQILDATE